MTSLAEKQAILKRLDNVEQMARAIGEEIVHLRQQKTELVKCLTRVGKEVKAAGGQYLVDEITDLLEKLLKQDVEFLRRQPSR